MNTAVAAAGIPPNLLKRAEDLLTEQPYPLLFVTLSGSHLYGFASADSDLDLRGAHILPTRESVGLYQPVETVERFSADHLLDLVSHDLKKYFLLLLKRNGYVLEQVHSPLILASTPEHDELRTIATGCVTRHHWRHYQGFANNEWRDLLKKPERRVKRLLYLYRILLCGIHMMRTGLVEPHLPTLLMLYPEPQVADLIERKVEGYEGISIPDEGLERFECEFIRLSTTLKEAGERSRLPEQATVKHQLNDLLLRIRRRYGGDFHEEGHHVC